MLGKLASTETRRFWLGQILAISATVIAIYLAADVGYQKAFHHDRMIGYRNRFHLIQSFRAEVEDNLEQIETLGARLTEVSSPERLGEEELEKYIWEVMIYDPQTVKIPNEILTETRRLYRQTETWLAAVRRGEVHPGFVQKNLAELAKRFRSRVLPGFAAELTRLRQKIEEGGGRVD